MKNTRDLGIALLLLFLLCVLCVYLAFRTYAHSDDYCLALDWKTASGWYDYTHSLWSKWTGRWSTLVVSYLYFELIGLEIQGYWSVVVIALFAIAAGFLFAARTLYGPGKGSVRWAVLCSVIFITLASAVDSLLFWMTGLSAYTLGYLFVPLALWLAVKVLASREGTHWWLSLAAGIALFWASGFTEFFLLPIWAFLLCSLIAHRDKKLVLFLGLFAVVGTLLSVLAPGNTHRAEAQALVPGLTEIAWGTLFYGFRGLLLPVIALAALSSLPFVARTVTELASSVQGSMNDKLILTIAAFAVIYPFAIEFALFWTLGAPGPGRAHNVSLFVLILSWPVMVAAARRKFSGPLPTLRWYGKLMVQLLVVALLIFVNPYKMLRTIVTGSSAQHHLNASHAEEVLMLPGNQGKDIVLPTDDLVTHDENHWLNKCVADYFSVRTVRASGGEPGARNTAEP